MFNGTGSKRETMQMQSDVLKDISLYGRAENKWIAVHLVI